MSKRQVENEIKSITKQLVEKYKPEKIVLFGSAAHGEFGHDSDLDFLIIKKQVPDNGIERRWEVRRLIQKSLPADFLVYTPEELEQGLRFGDPFVKTMIEEGKVLYD